MFHKLSLFGLVMVIGKSWPHSQIQGPGCYLRVRTWAVADHHLQSTPLLKNHNCSFYFYRIFRMLGKNSSLKEFSNTGRDCSGKWLSHPAWMYLKGEQPWHLMAWFIGGLGSAGIMIGLDDLIVFFQPKWFYESMI